MKIIWGENGMSKKNKFMANVDFMIQSQSENRK